MFVAWHYLGRVGFLIFFPIFVASFVLPQNPHLELAGTISAIALLALGVTGALLAVLLLFTSFCLACPSCGGRQTEFGASKKDGMWILCEQCGVTSEAGFLKLRVRKAPKDDSADPDPGVTGES